MVIVYLNIPENIQLFLIHILSYRSSVRHLFAYLFFPHLQFIPHKFFKWWVNGNKYSLLFVFVKYLYLVFLKVSFTMKLTLRMTVTFPQHFEDNYWLTFNFYCRYWKVSCHFNCSLPFSSFINSSLSLAFYS